MRRSTLPRLPVTNTREAGVVTSDDDADALDTTRAASRRREATGGGTERATEAARMSAVTPLRLRDVVTRRHKKSEQEDWRNLLAR